MNGDYPVWMALLLLSLTLKINNTMQNFEDQELGTSVNLGYGQADKESVYHFLYGSELYGTLFGVFGRFHFDRSADGDLCRIKKVSLKLLNYRGNVNIGFSRHSPYYDGEKNVYFGVKGTRKSYKNKYSFKSPIEIKKGERFPLVFNRILYPLPGFNFNVGKWNSSDYSEPIEGDIPRTRVFDSEFYYRNGIDHYKRILRPGMVGYDGLSIESLEEGQQFPSPRCHHSFVNLFF